MYWCHKKATNTVFWEYKVGLIATVVRHHVPTCFSNKVTPSPANHSKIFHRTLMVAFWLLYVFHVSRTTNTDWLQTIQLFLNDQIDCQVKTSIIQKLFNYYYYYYYVSKLPDIRSSSPNTQKINVWFFFQFILYVE